MVIFFSKRKRAEESLSFQGTRVLFHLRGSGENGSAVELSLGSASRLSLLPAEESSAGMPPGPTPALDPTRKKNCLQELSQAVLGRHGSGSSGGGRREREDCIARIRVFSPGAIALPQRVPATSLRSQFGLGELRLLRLRQPLGKVSRTFSV